MPQGSTDIDAPFPSPGSDAIRRNVHVVESCRETVPFRMRFDHSGGFRFGSSPPERLFG
jgi:hypothetical protein